MSDSSTDSWQYWHFLRINPGGGSRSILMDDAQKFFESRFSVTETSSWHRNIQKQLVALRLNGNEDTKRLADICLRCFISHQIKKICMSLEKQYQNAAGLNCEDLFSVLLDDDLRVKGGTYESKALMVLRTFDPYTAGLSTWTKNVVTRCEDLNNFLLEYGIYKQSQWAILNDLKVESLRSTFSGSNAVSDSVLEEYKFILKAYHDVYRSQRRQQNKRGKCEDPTQQQLEEMASRLPPKLTLSQNKLEENLQNLASMVRAYRATKKGCLPKQEPKQPIFDGSEDKTNWLETILINTDNESESIDYRFSEELLKDYRPQRAICLELAVEKAIDDRVRHFNRTHRGGRRKKSRDFLAALELYYNGNSMSEIAQKLGYQRQEQITRLLELKHKIRPSIKRSMLLELKKEVEEIGLSLKYPDTLKARSKEVEEFLDLEISEILEEDKKECGGKTTPDRRSLIALAIRKYFDKKRRQ